jgi:uncharacterized nucleotidyltransferase DUF6036
MASSKRPQQPWDSFLRDLDAAMSASVRLDCIGGFVITQFYGLERTTSDIDLIEIAPREEAGAIATLAFRGGSLARKHLVCVDRVGVAAVPENYEKRLIEMFPGAYINLRLMALDPYDLALSKLQRNGQKDRDDVRFLARSVPLDPEVLEQRYAAELRWQLGLPEREDLTLQLWMEMIREDKHGTPSNG